MASSSGRGTPPKVDPLIASAMAAAPTAELEAELASLRVRERGLAERLNATLRLIEVARAELRSRELGVKPRRGR